MGSVRVKMNGAGVKAILNGGQVESDIDARVQRIKARADSMGSGVYEADARPGKMRVHGMVKTTDAVSTASNAKNNTLVRSLDAGR